MDECNSIKNHFHKTPNIYPNLNAIPMNANKSNEQQFRLNKGGYHEKVKAQE